MSKTQAIKDVARAKVTTITRKKMHEIVVEGCVGVSGSPNYRLVIQVTLTANVDHIGILQATGIAYTNPTAFTDINGHHPGGDEYDYRLGRRIARGRAELVLGLQIMMLEGGCDGVAAVLEKQLVRNVHSTPMEICRWRKRK